VDNCDLCYHIGDYLRDSFPEALAPAMCYAPR